MRRRARVAALAAPALMAAAAALSNPSSGLTSLKACIALDSPTDRLACYDQIAGRAKDTNAATPPVSVASARSTSAAQAGKTAASSMPSPTSQQEFGLYAAEHPAPPPAPPSLSAKVIALGAAPDGHPTVTLEGNQLWELDATDTLLAPGDTVTINRAALGSFMLTTPTGRSHRARRLR